jgi:hypothetical protein
MTSSGGRGGRSMFWVFVSCGGSVAILKRLEVNVSAAGGSGEW